MLNPFDPEKVTLTSPYPKHDSILSLYIVCCIPLGKVPKGYAFPILVRIPQLVQLQPMQAQPKDFHFVSMHCIYSGPYMGFDISPIGSEQMLYNLSEPNIAVVDSIFDSLPSEVQSVCEFHFLPMVDKLNGKTQFNLNESKTIQ